MNPSGTTGGVNNNNNHNNNHVLVQEDGSLSFPMALIVLGIVLVLSSGSWGFGCLAITLGFGWAVCRSAMDQIPEQDKQDIRYNILYADDVVHELEAWEQALSLPQQQDNPNHTTTNPTLDQQRQQARIHCIAGLEALAKKYAKQQQQLTLMEAAARKKNPQEQDRSASSINNNVAPKHHLELLCQQAAYIAYRMFPTTGNDDNDPVMAAAFSLHALVAKDAQVRQRHLFQADVYGLNIPIDCMHNALESAQRETNDDREQQYAELLRKACLLMGALGDGDAAMATQIVDEGGLDAIFNAMNWYRYHQDVANWALWAIFVLNVDHGPNKVAMVEMGGVPLVIQTMKCNMISSSDDDCNDCDVEVARHGMAILFDLLKDDNNTQQQSDSASSNKQLNVWQIRKSALAAGLHVAVLQAMEQFSHTIDIIMMGQEILAGTDYRGPVPQYQPKKEDIAG